MVECPSRLNSVSVGGNSQCVTFGKYQLVGHGVPTSDSCGKYLHVKGCLREDLHKGVRLDGKDYTGKMYGRLVHCCCHKPSCPICYKGWASRQGHRIEARLAGASRLFLSEPEHFVVGIPSVDVGLDYEVLRAKVVEALYARDILGGCLIFHGFRYADRKESMRKHVPFGWRRSVHWHCLGYLRGGYARCRSCPKRASASASVCAGCHGFEAHTRELYQKDGFIVKVAEDREGNVGKRISMFWTSWYLLEHSTIRTDVKRPHPLTWWGTCSYRRLHVKVEKHKDVCPICGEPLVKLIHCGERRIVVDRDSPDYVSHFTEDLYDKDGLANWCEASSGAYGWRSSGSYEE